MTQFAVNEPAEKPAAFYRPDMARLRQIAAAAPVADETMASHILRRAGEPLALADLASLLHGVLSGDRRTTVAVLQASARIRRHLFGDWVVPMAPVEIANTCASDCLFCGWRLSNRAMKRMRLPVDLALLQVEYLLDLGIHYIEFVSGDDLRAVRETLPVLIRETRDLFRRRGVDGKVSFCTLALTQVQYGALREAGADNMIVWQETYDPTVFRQHIVGGPKAFGIGDDWKTVPDGDGCQFRIESQERALRAGLEVAVGSMLGLNPDICTEFLATVEHARYLAAEYGASPDHPIIIGMPVWNPITTHETDLRPGAMPSLAQVFPALAALYLLALPDRGTWVFPNCRVPMRTQVEAVRAAGAFTSTEVKLGPGGYLPSILRRLDASDPAAATKLRSRVLSLLREVEGDAESLERALDEREQFVHHYHAHEVYARELRRNGLRLASGTRIP
ncbi:MAG: hypothetical protein N2111_04305 [Candidatus Sumerlaeaceae bacterium]|nr:hypothetical protein [Candidatus Sumerlaeaceae bacterium]